MTPAAPLSSRRRSNPFATRFVRPGSLDFCFDPSHSTRDAKQRRADLVSALKRARIGLIVGPHGSGKSTLLRALETELTERFPQVRTVSIQGRDQHASSWKRIGDVSSTAKLVLREQSLLPANGLLVVDGLEQLAPLVRRFLAFTVVRSKRYLLATCHRPQPPCRVLNRWSLLSPWSVLHETRVDRRLVTKLTEILLQDQSAKRQQTVRAHLARQDWTKLDNVRDLWFNLYDQIEDL